MDEDTAAAGSVAAGSAPLRVLELQPGTVCGRGAPAEGHRSFYSSSMPRCPSDSHITTPIPDRPVFVQNDRRMEVVHGDDRVPT